MLVQIDSNDKNVLIIGGDKSLLQSLVKGGAIVTVVAKKENISSDLVDLLSSGEVAWFNRSALARDVAGKDYVLSFENNHAISLACKAKGIFYADPSTSIKPVQSVTLENFSITATAFGHSSLLNNSLSNKLLSYVPAYVTEAVGAFEALSLEFEEAVDDYDSRTSFLHFIADNWSLEAISSISNETIAALLDLFRSGDFNPTPFAVGIDDNLLKAEKLFERTLSQTTSVADDLTIKSPSPLPLRPQTPTDALPVPAASLDILVKVDRKNVKTITASEAISNIAYQLSDFAFIYPVVASEYPGESMLTWSEEGKVNQEGAVTKVINITTQPGAGQTVMGTLLGGSKANVIMSSAALGHLVPSMFGFQRRNVYPVFHVAAHSIDQDLVIHFDHSDVYKVAHTGFTILASSSHQEAQDLALIAHLLAKVSTTPVLHFFDGSLLAAQKSAIYVLEESQVSHALQLTETLIAEPFNGFTEISKKVESVLGRTIKPLEYVGCPRATTVFISMGHSSDLISKAVHDLVGNGAAVGCVIIRMYRPWSVEHFVDLIPAATTKIVVIDQAERISPLAVDVEASFYGKANEPSIMTRKFKEGLENIHPAAVKEFILSASSGLVPELIELSPRSEIHDSNVVQAIFWDQKDAGTLNALPLLAKDHIKVGPYFQQSFVQNLSTDYEPSQVAHLRFSQNHIDVHHLIDQADVVMCNSLGAAKSYNFAASIRRNGILFINSELSGEELWNSLDSNVQQTLVEKNVVVYHLDATLVSENYTIFYGKAKDYIIEILVAVFYHLAYPYEVAKKFLSAQSQRITSSSSSRNVEKSLKEAILFALNHLKTLPTGIPKGDNHHLPAFVKGTVPSKSQFVATEPASENVLRAVSKHEALLPVIFPSYKVSEKFRPDLENVYTVTVTENTRLTPDSYERNVFHMELDITGSGLKYDIGNALGVYAKNDSHKVTQFLSQHGLDPKQTIFIDRHDEEGNCFSELRSLEQLFIHNLDVFGKPGKKFYQYLATKATSDEEKEIIAALLESSETLDEFVEQYTPTFADLLVKFPSAKFSVEELIRTIPAIKPRLYSISSSQRAHPNSVHLLIVLVDWIDKHGVTRFGQATNFLVNSKIGDLLTVTLKPSVMKLPPSLETPVIMSGLGTGMAPFRAFIEERMYWKRKGKKVGPMALYFGSRNRANEYLYGEELEAYHSEGILNHLRLAFSRDQAEKVYIQHKIQEDRDHLHDLIVKNKGSFYLCGPTWPVPDITEALLTAFESSMTGEEALSFIEDLKEEDRFVLEMNPNLNPFNLNQGQQFQGLPLGVGQQYNGQMGLQQQQQQQSMGIQQHYQHPLGGMQQQQNVIGMQQIRPHPFRNQRPRPMVFNPLARTGIHPKANPITPQNQQVIEHSRQIKSRISQALDRDQHLVTNPDLMPFKDRNDMITKLMAFHVLQFPEMVLPLENDPTADLNDLEQRFEKASKEVNLEVERIMSEFASSLVDSN